MDSLSFQNIWKTAAATMHFLRITLFSSNAIFPDNVKVHSSLEELVERLLSHR